MKFKGYILLFILIGVVQEMHAQMFPIIKNGKWGAISLEGKILIQPSYEHIGTFHNGFAIAAKNEKFGVIDSLENNIVPFHYEHIRNDGNNHFVLKRNNSFQLYNVDSNETFPEKYEQIEIDSANYYFIQKNNKWGVLNGFKSVIPTYYDTVTYNFNKQLLICDSSDLQVIYQQNGKRLFHAGKCLAEGYFFKDVIFNGALANQDITTLTLLQNKLFLYRESDHTGLLNADKQEIILENIYDTIYNNQHWIVFKRADSVGFCDMQGTIVQDLKPYEFYVNPNGIWTKAVDPNNVSNTFTGFLFNNGNSIPAKFDKINFNKSYYFTSKGRKKGLYTAQGQKILSCKYDEIIAEKSMVKAYRGKAMTKITLSDAGRQISKQEFANTVRVTLNSYQKYEQSPSPFNRTNENFSLEYKYGWFGDTIRDTMGKQKRIRLGIKLNDTVKQRPVYDEIDYMDDYAVTRASNTFKRTGSNGTRITFQPHDYFKFNQAKRMNRLRLQYSSPSDWTSNLNTEIINQHGLFFMDSLGNLSDQMGFIDNEYDSLKRFITYGKGPSNTCNYAYCLYAGRIVINSVFSRNRTIAFNEGQWGFMDRSGKERFKGSFDAVENFKLGTSIVTKGGKGLINKDSLVIPTKYQTLRRYSNLGDTIFLAQKNEYKQFFTDSLLQPYDFQYHSIIKRIEDKLWIKKSAKSNGILDKNLHFVELKGIIKKNYNQLLLIKKRGLYGISDLAGNTIIPTKFNAITKLNNGFSLLEKRTYGYANQEGKIILEPKYKKIVYANESYIIAELNGLQGLYNQEGILLIDHIHKSIQINEIDGRILIVKKNNKAYYLSENLEKETIVKSTFQIIGSIGSYYIYSERNKIGLLDSNQKIVVAAQFENVQVITPDIFELRIGKKKKLFTLKDKTISEKFYRESKWVFEDVYLTKQASSCQFYHASGALVHQENYYEVDESENGLALIRSHKGSFFMNRNFKNEFNEFYNNANSFYGGYACISSSNGWQIINRKGFRKTYPSYGYLKPLFPNVFEAKTYALKGVFNSQGKELVPVVYEKINIIDNLYFQAVNDGAIHYYDLFGKRIY